jgi:hypothetical protein
MLGGIHFLRGLKGQFPSKVINVEELALTLDAVAARNVSHLSPFVGSWNELLSRFDGSRGASRDCIKELRQGLRDHIKEMLKTPDSNKVEYFQQFRRFFKELPNVTCIDVFTLNYDLCVETALYDAEITFTTGVSDRGWDAELFSVDSFNVRLYKLHGSLDWYKDSETGDIYSITNPPEDRVPASDYDPLIIFGITNKLQSLDPFLHLSFTFSRMIRQAKVLVTIGYGFGDDYINQMILQGMSADRDKILLVVSYDEGNAKDVIASNLKQGSVFADAGRIRYLGGGCKIQLTTKELLKRLTDALASASDEGPFV